MKCSYCGGADSRVVDSRHIGDGIRRRRQCLSCGARFTTYERVDLGGIFVVKKDGRREKYSRDKLSSGIRKACEKCPLPIGAIEKVIDNVEAELYHAGKTETTSSLIGDLVMQRLKQLDHIAYIRFASVYREFTDLDTLKEVVDTLAQGESSLSIAGQSSQPRSLKKAPLPSITGEDQH